MIKVYATCIVMLIGLNVFGQSITVTGQLFNKNSGKILEGATVVEKGTDNGTTTDINGNYSIKVPGEDAVLIYSYLGYAASTIAVDGRTTIDVGLTPSSNMLSETVITALGIQRDKRDLGYAIQKLDSRQMSEVKSTNMLDNIAGKVAGVNVIAGPTGVGSSSKITIRGESSFTNNNPLFVVDGVPINNNSIINNVNDAAEGLQPVDFGNGAMEVNADDIQSISVLKGPSAAALYGTRASNGVILITTKNGRGTKGLGVSFNSTTYMERPFRLPKFQNKYGQGNSGKFEYVDGLGGGVNDNISYSYGPELDKGNLVEQYDSPVTLPDGTVVRGGDVAVHGGAPITATPFNSHPDNLKNFYETGVTTMNNLAISNGGDMGSFRLSYTDMRSDSYIPGVNLDRKNAAANLNFTPNEKLKVTTSANYVYSNSDNRPANGYGSENINYALVAWGPRSLDIDPMKSYWQPGLKDVQQYSFNYTYFDNPYFSLLENRNSFNRNRLFGNIRARYAFTDKISIAVRTGIDYSAEQRQFRRAFSSNRFKNGAYVEQEVGFRENNTDALLNYRDKFGDFTVDLSAGANRMDQSAASTETRAIGLAQPGVFSLNNAAAPIEVNEFRATKRINSAYGLAKFGYKNYLFLDITGRNDWSSALATPLSAANTSFFYPSFSGSFILSNVVKMPKAISYTQLRASYAQVGNDTDPYQTASVYNSGTPYNSQPTLSEQATIANAALLPEKTSAIEVGGNIGFWNDRVNVDVTYYDSRTENQIIALPISVASGYTQQVVNGNTVRNRGLEIILGLSPIQKRNFSWSSQFNFSRNVATVENLPAGTSKLTLGYNRVYDNINQTVFVQVEEGGRIGDLYGTGYKKTDDGRFIVDDDGNFIVDNDLKKLGNYNPDFMLGFANRFNYKNWHLSFLLDWKQGGILVSRTLALAGVAGQLKETEDRPASGIVVDGVVNTGTEENPVYVENTQAITAESYYRQYYDRNHEENNVYDASFVKLRQFAIGYTFTAEKLFKSFLKNVKGIELSIIGRNLFALSHTPHFDPEQFAVQGNRFISGVEDMSYPTTTSVGFKLGINL